MNTLEFTYRTYKTFVKAVPTDSSVAGFHFLKQSINREYLNQETRMLQLNCEMMGEHVLKFLGSIVYFVCGSTPLFSSIKQSIKGRVERDCLNVSQNKTEVPSNTYSANASLEAPTSADTCCMMRVQKETGIERGGRPENEGRPIKVRNNYSKLTLKFNLLPIFIPYQV